MEIQKGLQQEEMFMELYADRGAMLPMLRVLPFLS